MNNIHKLFNDYVQLNMSVQSCLKKFNSRVTSLFNLKNTIGIIQSTDHNNCNKSVINLHEMTCLYLKINKINSIAIAE